RSHAADRMRSRSAASGILLGTRTELQLLPRPATESGAEAALFGRFVKPGATPDVLPSEASCPPEMVEVEGEYCPYVEQKCLRWLDPDTKLQCAEFDKATASARCSMQTQHKRFCIDRYEWPNKVGALPV